MLCCSSPRTSTTCEATCHELPWHDLEAWWAGQMIEHELFAAALTELRGERTQREIARAAGIHQSAWSCYEAGKRLPREDQRQQIFAALGCTPEDFELALWRVLSKRLLPRHVADMVKIFTGQETRHLLSIDLDKVPPSNRPLFKQLRDGLLVNSFHLDGLGRDFETLFNLCRQATLPKEPARGDQP